MRLKIGVRAADRFDDAVDDRMEIVAVEAGVAEHQAFDVDERIVDDRRQRRRQVRKFLDAGAPTRRMRLRRPDRLAVWSGQSVSGRVALGGGRICKNKKKKEN